MLNVAFSMRKSYRVKGFMLLCCLCAFVVQNPLYSSVGTPSPLWFLNRYNSPKGLFANLFCFYFCSMLAHEYIFLVSTLAMDAR